MCSGQILILSKSFFNLDNCWELIDSLIAKISASKGSLMEEKLLKVSWILSKSNEEKISKL